MTKVGKVTGRQLVLDAAVDKKDSFPKKHPDKYATWAYSYRTTSLGTQRHYFFTSSAQE
jgi:hypothetical protein